MKPKKYFMKFRVFFPNINDNKMVKVKFCEMEGAERFRNKLINFLDQSDGLLLNETYDFPLHMWGNKIIDECTSGKGGEIVGIGPVCELKNNTENKLKIV